MGSNLSLKSPNMARTMEIFVGGTSPIKRVELISNEGVLTSWAIGGEEQDLTLSYEDRRPADTSLFYYVRVIQMDADRAWSSPVWVDLLSSETKTGVPVPAKRDKMMHQKKG